MPHFGVAKESYLEVQERQKESESLRKMVLQKA